MIPASAYSTAKLAEAREMVGNAFRSHRLRMLGGQRRLAMRHTSVSLGDIAFNRLTYGAEVEVVAPALKDFYLLQLTLAGQCVIDSRDASLAVKPGRIAVMNPDRTYVKRWSPDAEQIIVRVERRLMEACSNTRGQIVHFDFTSIDAGTRAAPLYRFLRFIESELGDPSGNRAAGNSAGPIAQHLAQLMLDCIPHATRRAAPVPAPIGRAEQCMRERYVSPLTITEVAHIAGIGVRSLEAGFKAVHGMSPMQYLHDLRLDAAHARLIQEPTSSVAEVAATAGFRHGGRFAAAYKTKFGCTPRQTLRAH